MNQDTINYPSIAGALPLTESQIETMLAIFHSLQITDEQVKILDSRLKQVLDRAVVGLATVVEYLQFNRDDNTRNPSGDKVGYLMDCSEDEI